MRSAGRLNLSGKPWIWSYLGAFLVWLAAIVFTHGYGAGGMLTAALALAVFSVIAGVAQMFVITLGPGNVDLSLPANIGLASAVAMKMMNGSDSLIAVGFLGRSLLRHYHWSFQLSVDLVVCAFRQSSRPFPPVSSSSQPASATAADCRSSLPPVTPLSRLRKSAEYPISPSVR